MHILEYKQSVPISLQDCWDFFSSTKNLALITPPYLGFSESSNGKAMYAGQIIIHEVTPIFSLPIRWVTEITHIQHLDYFIDQQRFGPYKFWHHEHRFIQAPGGVNIIDSIHYMLPFGLLGRAVNHLKVSRDLEAIFAYRRQKISELFGVL